MHTRPIALAASAVVAASWSPALSAYSRPVADFMGVVRRGRDESSVYLTFDDGPHPEGTPAILDALDESGAKATFFMVGRHVESRPDLAAEVSARGHEAAIHCYQHRNELFVSPLAIYEDMRRGLAVIESATETSPRFFRPPLGILTAPGLLAVKRLGLTSVHWSNDGRDWTRRATAASIAARVTDRLSAGDIVLFHDADHYCADDSWRATRAALPAVLHACRASGLEPVTLSNPPERSVARKAANPVS